MPSFKYPTRGYNGGWQGPGSMLRTYSGGWVVPKNAFYSNGAGGWVRFFGDDISFSHGNLTLIGYGSDEEQGGEGGPPFTIHLWGQTIYELHTDGTVQYYGGGAPGSGPSLTNGRWAEAGVDASLYEVRWNAPASGQDAWTPFSAYGPQYYLGEGGGDYTGDIQIRHKASGIIVSSFSLRMVVT